MKLNEIQCFERQYFYYHCQHGCKERFKADLANDEIVKKFGEKIPNMGVIRAFREGLENHLKLSETNKIEQKEKLSVEIERAKSRIANARKLMLDKEIDASEYKEIKNEYEEEIGNWNGK